jgi:hypothetical protein
MFKNCMIKKAAAHRRRGSAPMPPAEIKPAAMSAE